MKIVVALSEVKIIFIYYMYICECVLDRFIVSVVVPAVNWKPQIGLYRRTFEANGLTIKLFIINIFIAELKFFIVINSPAIYCGTLWLQTNIKNRLGNTLHNELKFERKHCIDFLVFGMYTNQHNIRTNRNRK